MISSKRLLEGCIEKFDMLQEDKRSFEEDIRELVLYFCQLKQVSFERRKETSIDFDVLFLEQVSRLLPSLLQKSGGIHYKSFYTGWIEGRLELIKGYTTLDWRGDTAFVYIGEVNVGSIFKRDDKYEPHIPYPCKSYKGNKEGLNELHMALCDSFDEALNWILNKLI